MTVLYNNFNGGPDGTDITNTNSGQGEDDVFDTYNNPASLDTILKFKSAVDLARPTSEFVMESATGASNSTVYVGWTTSMGEQTQYWCRFYTYFTVLPNNALSPAIFHGYKISPLTHGGVIGVMSSDGTKRLFTENVSGSSFVATTSAIIEDAWFRVEARFQQSTTTGNGEVRYYENPDADMDDYTEVLTFSNWNLGTATCDLFAFGHTHGDANQETQYTANVALSNEGWIGPAPFKAGKGVPGIQPNPIAIHTTNW